MEVPSLYSLAHFVLFSAGRPAAQKINHHNQLKSEDIKSSPAAGQGGERKEHRDRERNSISKQRQIVADEQKQLGTGSRIYPTCSLARQTGSLQWQTGSLRSQTGSLISQAGSLISQTGSLISQVGRLISQTGSFVSQTGSLISQTGSQTGKEERKGSRCNTLFKWHSCTYLYGYDDLLSTQKL